MSLGLVRNMFGLWGIVNPEVVVIEGHNQFPDRKDEIFANGLQAAAEVASKF
ncbi:FMN-dependent NADH-azoreductase 1 [compost metagenome]